MCFLCIAYGLLGQKKMIQFSSIASFVAKIESCSYFGGQMSKVPNSFQ